MPERWKPVPGTTWHIQLQKDLVKYDAAVYDIDLYDTAATDIEMLHSQGKKVICYFSAGSFENWRKDAALFPPSVVGKPLIDWQGENWLDIRQIDILAPIMKGRLDLAVQKGCDAVDPDNVDGFTQDSGFDITYAEQLAYNKFLAEEAHKRGLAIGLKNDLSQIPDLVNEFDFAVNEECAEYSECDKLLPFVMRGKPVFGVLYGEYTDEKCEIVNRLAYDFIYSNTDLDGTVRIQCRN